MKIALGKVTRVIAGIGFPLQFQGRTSGQYPFYKVGDISRAWLAKQVVLAEAEHYVDDDARLEMGGKPIPAGATVFAKIGAAVALNRRAILGSPSLIDNNCFAIVPEETKLDRRFLYYFMCATDLGERTRATTVPSLRKGDIESLDIPLWSIPRQRRIVAEIEKQFTRLDAAVATLKRVQANLERARASVLKAAVEGRLVPTEAELARAEGRSYEPASVLLESILEERKRKHDEAQAGAKRKKKYKPPVAPDVEGLPELPEGWTWVSVDQALAVQDSGATVEQGWSPKCDPEPADTAEWGVIKTTAVQAMNFLQHENKRLPLDLLPKHQYEIRTGDLLITRAGPRRRAGVTCLVKKTRHKLILCDKAYRLRVATGIDPRFMEATLNAPPVLDTLETLKTGISDSGVNLTQTRLLPMALALPPTREQHRIVSEIERRLSIFSTLEATVERNLHCCARLRQSILKRAFEGKLVPQDPTDEPASELLARIQAQIA